MMLKFVIVSLLAFCVIQAAEARHVNDHQSRGLQEIIQAIKDTAEKVKNAITSFQETFQKAIKDLQDKLKNIISEIDIPALVDKLQVTINNILKEAGVDAAAAKECIETEKNAIDALVKNIEISMTTCVSTVDDLLRSLKDEALDIDDKGKQLISSINNKVLQCIKENPNPIEAIKCLQNQFEQVKNDVDTFINTIQTTIATGQDLIKKATENLTQCVGDIKNTITVGQEKIINDFKSCVSEIVNKPTTRLSIEEIIQGLKDIVKKISDAISDISNQFPQFLEKLQEKIKELLAKLNIDKIMAEIQKKIEDILNNAGIDPSAVTKCIAAEEIAVKNIVQETRDATVACVKKVDDVTRNLKDKASHLKDKATDLVSNINDRVMTCVKSGLPNALNCLKDLVDPVTQEVTQMVSEIKNFVKEAESEIQQAGADFTTCIVAVQSDLSTKEKVIIEDFKKCIQPAALFIQRDTIDDIIVGVLKMIQKIKDNIIGATTQFLESLKKLEDKVKDILANVDLDKFVVDVKKKIEDVLKQAGIDATAAEACIASEEGAIKELVTVTHDATVACVTKVDDATRDLKDTAVVLQDKVETLIQKHTEQAKKCTSDINTMLTCFKNLSQTVAQDVSDITKEMTNFIAQAESTMQHVGFDFTTCMVSVQFDLYTVERAILSDFKECIAEINAY